MALSLVIPDVLLTALLGNLSSWTIFCFTQPFSWSSSPARVDLICDQPKMPTYYWEEPRYTHTHTHTHTHTAAYSPVGFSYQPQMDHIPTTTNHIPTTYQPHTDQINLFALLPSTFNYFLYNAINVWSCTLQVFSSQGLVEMIEEGQSYTWYWESPMWLKIRLFLAAKRFKLVVNRWSTFL